MKIGDTYIHREQPGVTAKIIAIDSDEVTVLVDGYAASDTFTTQRFNEEWSDGDKEELDRQSDSEDEAQRNRGRFR